MGSIMINFIVKNIIRGIIKLNFIKEKFYYG